MTGVIIFGIFILAMLVLGGFIVRFAIRLGRDERRKIVSQQLGGESGAAGDAGAGAAGDAGAGDSGT